MDLKRIETWERGELEREARRIGVWAPQRKDTAELIRRIRAHHTAPLRRAGRFLKKAASFALSLRPQSLPSGRERPSPAPRHVAAKAAPKAAPEPKPASAPKPAAATGADEPAAGMTTRLPPKKVIADADLVGDDDAAKEPIPTRTMARLLAEQGHTGRALAIYKKLLRESPDDTSLAEEAASVGGRRSARRASTTAAKADDDDAHAAGEVVFVRGPDGHLIVAWSLPKGAAERAKSIVGAAGRPTARVVVVRPSSGGGVLRETFDLQAGPDAQFEGEGSIPAPPGSRVTAAIGLLAGERFVSVAHAEPRRV